MQPRRSLALIAGALLLAAPLSSCGFNKATDKPYTPAEGTNYRKGDVFVLGAVIAAGQPDSGTLIASFSNQSDKDEQSLESVAGAEGNTVTAGDFEPIGLAPQGFVNLATKGGITVAGNFGAGDVVPLSMNFADGETITMDVPVVYACQEYAGLDVSQDVVDVASATPTPTASDSTSASDSASASASASASVDASYTCGTSGGTGGES